MMRIYVAKGYRHKRLNGSAELFAGGSIYNVRQDLALHMLEQGHALRVDDNDNPIQEPEPEPEPSPEESVLSWGESEVF